MPNDLEIPKLKITHFKNQSNIWQTNQIRNTRTKYVNSNQIRNKINIYNFTRTENDFILGPIYASCVKYFNILPSAVEVVQLSHFWSCHVRNPPTTIGKYAKNFFSSKSIFNTWNGK